MNLSSDYCGFILISSIFFLLPLQVRTVADERERTTALSNQLEAERRENSEQITKMQAEFSVQSKKALSKQAAEVIVSNLFLTYSLQQ